MFLTRTKESWTTLNTFPGDIAQSVSVIHRAYQRDARLFFKGLNLNSTSAYILLILCKKGSFSQNELSRELLINKGQIAREVKRLVTNGFVTQVQSEENHTVNVVTITPEGKKLIPRIVDYRNDWWNSRLQQIDATPDSPLAQSLYTIGRQLIANQDHDRLAALANGRQGMTAF
ncbi:hypothetical protein KIM372_07360 [Bombiscardovia nodaiensis]|uniref:HTH marR-type domain-containing protein n=1 Tax=Bombiscardovia nodaiensis TaxID=2932181 RepID=A0ABM8B7I1_9BIFI|nr:hypothetical protein KIM372_07360 [Bombiscardovia nodaiensis]